MLSDVAPIVARERAELEQFLAENDDQEARYFTGCAAAAALELLHARAFAPFGFSAPCP